ncbi:MAG: restriction endonuclease subunit S [Rickettsiales bacterium]|nr:restriction endonuclease subunit S [Rickettsiales bacterium]
MSKDKQIIPSLRFPEFQSDGAWSEKALKKLADRITDKNKGSVISRVLTNSATDGVVDQRDYFDKDIANQSNLEGYSIVDEGDYVYNPRTSTSAPVGPISKNKLGKGVMSPLYTVFRFKEKTNDFFEHYFKSSHWHHYLRRVSNTGARHDRMSITNDAFEAMPLPLPPTDDEQQKIAACLSSIDEVIELEGKKLEVLRDHKKGLMQNLFPAEGETLPKFRFPEFKNDPEWEEKPLNQVFTRIKTKNEENNLNCLTISAQDGLVSQLEYFNKKVSAKDLTGYYLLNKGDFAYNKSYSNGYPMGAIKRLKRYDKGVVSTLYICFKINTKDSGEFFEYFFDQGMINSEIEKIAQEGARNHGLLNVGINDFFEQINLIFPKLKEQEKIAECLASADGFIAAQEEKIEQLKEHKKGLMQQLFPNPEELKG